MSISISPRDREILRTLGKQVAEHAADPIQERKKKLWQMHNDLQSNEPLIFIDPENGWNEIITPDSLQCENDLARGWERFLKIQLFHAEHLKDDMVVDDVMNVGLVSSTDGWGLPIFHEGGGHGGAYHVRPSIEDYDEAFEKLHFPNYTVDRQASMEILDCAHDVFDGILQVKPYHTWWWSLGLTAWFIDLRGLEDFLCDLIVEPESVHRLMSLMCDGVLELLDRLERENLLWSNNGNYYIGSGGFGYTTGLPKIDGTCRASQMWGFVESQETSSVSPEMYGEFIFPYHQKIASRFGLNYYGCCEAFEGRWPFVSRLPNLRRVSCSPWCCRAKSAELLGNRYVSAHKISPTPLACANMDEEEVRRNLRDALDHSAGTIPELIMKDNHTLGNCPHNAVRWVELAREEIANT